MEENNETNKEMKNAMKNFSVAGRRAAERLVRDTFLPIQDKEVTVKMALGDSMFQTAHSIHRQSASLPVLEMDLEKLIETMENLEFMGVLDSQIMYDFGLHKVAALDMGGEDPDITPDMDLHLHYTVNSGWYSALTQMMDEHRHWTDKQHGLVDLGQQRDYIHQMADHIRDGVMTAIERLTDIDRETAGTNRFAGTIMNRAARLFQEYGATMSSSYAHRKWGYAFAEEAIDRDDRQRDGMEQRHRRTSATLLHALLRFNREPTEPLRSQKARGIQRLAERQGETHIWQTMSAMWLTMEDAEKTTLPLLMETLRIVFGAQSLFTKPLYVRTCPASPRSGVLPNATATSPIDLHNAIRELHLEMTDEDSQFYDPDGALCIMEKIDAICSAVLPVGHSIISVGFGHSAATAAEGSIMQLALSPNLAQSIKDAITALNIEDGMDNHEVELVWDVDGLYLEMDSPPWTDYVKSPNVEAFLKSQNIHSDQNLTAINVQVRGLHGTKEEVHGMPNVPGHEVVRGNMWAAGKCEHLVSINVGKGDLDDCAHLEHMIDTNAVPQGGVIFVPTGTDACHAAGLALQGGIPIVYGIPEPQPPYKTWAEVAPGWVVSTDTPDELTIQGWRPAEHQEWFLKGFQDGDQYWDFQNIVTGQFFHEFISGPKQDPDFVAYMAGIYTAWLTKATLAVGMGEARHAYNGQNGVFSPELGFGHLFFSNVLFGDAYGVSVHKSKSTIFHTGEQSNVAGSRTTYYYPMKHKEFGSDNLHQLLKFYEALFDCGEWGGSYGGQAYAKSLQLAADIMPFIKAMEEGERVNFNNLLNAINLLENTQHNTAWFFNKFTSKTYLDISTAGHKSLVTIPQQYIICAAHQIRYYSSRDMEEMVHQNFLDDEKYMKQVVWPDVSHIFKGHAHSEYKALWDTVYDAVMNGDLDSLFKDYPDICGATVQHFEDSIYCEDCDSKGCGCITQLKHYHKTGVCSNPQCSNKECMDYAITRQVEITGLEMILAAKSVGTVALTISNREQYLIDTDEVKFPMSIPPAKTSDGHDIIPLHDQNLAIVGPAKTFNKATVTDSLSHIHNWIVGSPTASSSNSSVFTEMPPTPDTALHMPFTTIDTDGEGIFFSKGVKMGIYTVGEEMSEEVCAKGGKSIWFLNGRRENNERLREEFSVGMDLVYHDQILADIEHEARRLKAVLGEEKNMHLLALLGVIQHDTYRALSGRFLRGRDAPKGHFPIDPKKQRFALRLSDRHKMRYYDIGEMVDVLEMYGLEEATNLFGMCWIFSNVYHHQLMADQRFLTARNNPQAYDSFSVSIVDELCYRRVGRHMNNPMSVLLYMQRLISRESFAFNWNYDMAVGSLTTFRQEQIANDIPNVMVQQTNNGVSSGITPVVAYAPFRYAMKALTTQHKKHWLVGDSTFMTFLRETMRRKKI